MLCKMVLKPSVHVINASFLRYTFHRTEAVAVHILESWHTDSLSQVPLTEQFVLCMA